MAHINHFRNIIRLQRYTIEQAIPMGFVNISFGAFGGTKHQRDRVGLYEIRRNFGHKGIVLIHNDPEFEARLGDVYTINPGLREFQGTIEMYLANSNGSQDSYYDPLYGMTANNILDAIAPIPADNRTLADIQVLRSLLADYLEIMNYRFRMNDSAFGDYPYNLNLLYELTSMSYTELDQRVLQFLPDTMFSALKQRLSAPDAQQKAFYVVRSFSMALGTCLWTRRGFASHTRLSIIDAVRRHQLISIYVPGSRKEILDYLTCELKALNDTNTPYLLLTSDIAINESPEFKKLFLNNHRNLPYSTGILAADLSSVVNTAGSGMQGGANSPELSALFSQLQEMYVFSCSSALAAAPFSEGIGHYYRQITETHRDTHRAPFQIFRSHGQGQTQREVQQAIINPEELTNLGNGCLIYGSNHPVPLLINHFAL